MAQHLGFDERSVPIPEGTLLWAPSSEWRDRAPITRYVRWLRERRGLAFGSYQELWKWSVEELEGFWASIWDFFQVQAHRPYQRVLGERAMPGAQWFPGAELNYAEHILRRRDGRPAVIYASEASPLGSLSYSDLSDQVAAAAAGLRRLGVGRGDRVAGFLPNRPETLIAFLAAASLGAIWSCCSPEFGVRSVVERLEQIEPKVLLAVDGYQYNGRFFDRRAALAEVLERLPTVKAVVLVDPGPGRPQQLAPAAATLAWPDLLSEPGPLQFEPVPFDHPLWVLYSSGTTGLPKPIVHGHGGILLDHLRCLALQTGLGPDDRFFWFTSTGWMMWNKLVSGLLLGCTIVLYDGSPTYPDLGALWRLAERAGITCFGASAPYLLACRKAGIAPGREHDLSALKSIGSTGAPLPPEGFQWVYEAVKRDLHLGSTSGGTDVCTSFVGPCPLLPVHAGELQCRYLGAKVEAFDEDGRPLIGQVGELVLTAPLPSMPLFFWGDPDGRRYRESYFDRYPGVWRHGDWIKITERGSCVIYGRSDSTLNRGGVRMGASEFYRVVEELPEIADSLVVDTSRLGAEGELVLFVVLAEGAQLDAALQERIRAALARELSPRHVPDRILPIPETPRTLNNKKMEVPVKRILAGVPIDQTASPDAMSNPDSLQVFADLARQWPSKPGPPRPTASESVQLE